jgi:hypothetical protein
MLFALLGSFETFLLIGFQTDREIGSRIDNG